MPLPVLGPWPLGPVPSPLGILLISFRIGLMGKNPDWFTSQDLVADFAKSSDISFQFRLRISRVIFDGFVKSPSAALRFIFRHCSVLLCTPHSSRFARLASGSFYCAVQFCDFLRSHQLLEIEIRMRAVHPAVGCLVPRAQRNLDDMGFQGFPADFRQMEERAIGQPTFMALLFLTNPSTSPKRE
jgi:hypothetical protein